MRLIAFEAEDGPHIGAVRDKSVTDLAIIDKSAPRDLGETIKSGRLKEVCSIFESFGNVTHHNLTDINIALPVASPGKILCLGLNYLDHVSEGPFDKQPYPTVFMRGSSSLVPANKPIIKPKVSDTLDYEAELVLVIGNRCKNLKADNALDVIAGYSCFNDCSVREFQRHTIQWTMGKNFDATGSFGPILVTPDELPLGASGLKIECRLNGQTVQSSVTDKMIFSVLETLIYLSRAMTLNPGDLVVMGTPSGVGHARTPPIWMNEGDRVEVEIEQIGTLENPIRLEVEN